MKGLVFKTVIRAYFICALMTSILGFVLCFVHEAIYQYIIVLIYAWVIWSPIAIFAMIIACMCGAPKDWIERLWLNCICSLVIFIANISGTINLIITHIAIKVLPYNVLYYYNGIENRTNDTVISILIWISSFVFLVLFIIITSILYKYLIHLEE